MNQTRVKTCEECKGTGMEVFIEQDGTEKLGAGFCTTCIGRGLIAFNFETERWEPA